MSFPDVNGTIFQSLGWNLRGTILMRTHSVSLNKALFLCTNFWPRYDLNKDVMRKFSGSQPVVVNQLYKNRVDYQLEAIQRVYDMR
jgi:hypothetical protein